MKWCLYACDCKFHQISRVILLSVSSCRAILIAQMYRLQFVACCGKLMNRCRSQMMNSKVAIQYFSDHTFLHWMYSVSFVGLRMSLYPKGLMFRYPFCRSSAYRRLYEDIRVDRLARRPKWLTNDHDGLDTSQLDLQTGRERSRCAVDLYVMMK